MSDSLATMEVAFIDEWECIHILHIVPDAVYAARERGWMVFDDFEADCAHTQPHTEEGDAA